jgi:hypothetical protein
VRARPGHDAGNPGVVGISALPHLIVADENHGMARRGDAVVRHAELLGEIPTGHLDLAANGEVAGHPDVPDEDAGVASIAHLLGVHRGSGPLIVDIACDERRHPLGVGLCVHGLACHAVAEHAGAVLAAASNPRLSGCLRDADHAVVELAHPVYPRAGAQGDACHCRRSARVRLAVQCLSLGTLRQNAHPVDGYAYDCGVRSGDAVGQG